MTLATQACSREALIYFRVDLDAREALSKALRGNVRKAVGGQQQQTGHHTTTSVMAPLVCVCLSA